jgi:hypothetical protein
MITASTPRTSSATLAPLAQLLTLRTIEQMVENGKLTQEQAALLLEQYAPGSTR